MTAIGRGWTGPAGRRVAHLRRDGDPTAATVLALHQTPLSSWTYRPLLEASTHPGPIVAFDTPGYGDSDPLHPGVGREAPPRLEEFVERLAAAVAEVAPTGPLVLVGQHTGAHLALLLTPMLGARVRGVVFQGLTLYTDDERADRAANYAPWIEPAPDGTHLAAIWERIGRLYPRADLRLRDRMVRDYLIADPGYLYAYLAVFAFDVAPAVEAFRATGVPSAVIIGGDDLVAARQHRVVEALGSEHVVLDGLTDHAVSEDPQRVAAAMDGWIASVLARPVADG
jgi:haloalkane dehalogenase